MSNSRTKSAVAASTPTPGLALPGARRARSAPAAVAIAIALLLPSEVGLAQQPPPAQPAQPAPGAPAQPPPAPAPAPAPPEPQPADPAATGAPPAPAAAQPPPAAAAAPIAPPAAAAPAAPPPVNAEDERDWSKRVTVQLGPLALKPIVIVGVYATPYVGDDAFVEAGDIAEEGGFRLRRARLGLGGELDQKVRFEVSAEIGSTDDGSARIHDGWLGYVQFPLLQVFAGAHEVPYSRSAMTGSGDNALLERPFAVRAMAPQHQVGVHVEGHFKDGLISYYGGLYNGLRRTPQFYEGYLHNYAPLGNRFGGLLYVGRLATEPLGRLGPTIEDVDHSKVRVGAGGGYFFSDGGARDIHSVGGDVLLHVAGIHVLGELLWSKSVPESEPSEPSTQIAEISSFGIAGEAGYMILRRRLGVTVRAEFIDPNTDNDDEGDNFIFTGGLSWRILGNENLKLGAEYTHREELFGLVLANDSLTIGAQLQL